MHNSSSSKSEIVASFACQDSWLRQRSVVVERDVIFFSCPFVMLCEQERLHNPAQPAGARKTLRLALARRYPPSEASPEGKPIWGATTFSSSRNFACRQGRLASNISLPPTRSAYLLVLRRLVKGGLNLSNVSNFSNLIF